MQAGPRVLGEAGRFSIQRELGRGEFSVVYLARDRESNETVALKLLERRALSRTARERFRREFKLSSALRHPNLARHHELFCDGGDWFFTMELVEGQDFVEHVRRDLTGDAQRGRQAPRQPWRAKNGSEFEACTPAGVERLRATLPQLIAAVATIHDAGLVHRDLHPANVRVTFEGRVVVLDYGLATNAATGEDPDRQHKPVGTLTYMAPEQWNHSATGPASDWYAVGVMLFEALTGAPPFSGSAEELFMEKRTVSAPRPSELVGSVPSDLDDLVAELLSTDPKQRPSGAELLRRVGE